MSSVETPPEQPTRSSRLRALIDDLILFGNILLETLRHEPESEAAIGIIKRFRTATAAAIIARITRGLMLAAALAGRVERSAKRIDNPPAPRLDVTPAKRPARPRPPECLATTDDDAALLARMPTAEEIAANIRTRPIGDVLADIANDLGLNYEDPLYRRIHGDIVRAHCATGLARLVRPLIKAFDACTPRQRAASQPVAPSAEPEPASFGTGPPFPLAA
jgi:hypothetical protein